MMNGQAPAPTQVPDGNMPVAVTFPINGWNAVLSLVSKGPWEIADPLIKEIHRQIQLEVDAKNVQVQAQPQASVTAE